MKLRAWAVSETGLVRQQNEDSVLVDGELGLYAVADGMGGHNGGAHASELALSVVRSVVASSIGDLEAAVTELQERSRQRWVEYDDPAAESRITEDLDPPGSPTSRDGGALPAAAAVLTLAARKASSSVHAVARERAELRGMGTTLTALLCEGRQMHLVHAGDSRAYLLRDRRLRQLTEDHSWIGEQVRSGAMTEDEAKVSQLRHVITRSIGFERDVAADTMTVALEDGDCFLLCSDGLSNHVDGAELEALMLERARPELPQALVALANERGGDDNISVVVVSADGGDEG